MEKADERVAHILPCFQGKYDVCYQGTQKTVHFAHSSVEFKYLSADCASKAPHSFVRCVVFTATSHFKGEGDCIAFHLKI
jgi:hypothetical protein